jgi:transcriptional regulator with XRE-family HTH domain
MWSVAQAVEDFADFIRRVREAQDLSTRDVASRSGGLISHGYVSQVENRTTSPDGIGPRRLLGLARGLGLSVEDLLARVLDLPRGELTSDQARLIGFFNTLPDDKKPDAIEWMQILSKRYGTKTRSMGAAQKHRARLRRKA